MDYILFLPLWYQYTLVVFLGLVIGSFLNVYIYRFHTGKSLSGHSHCMSCARTLTWYELLPVVSYLVLRGRCRTCGSYIPARYVLVEVLTAALFFLVFVTTSFGIMLFWWFALMSVLIVILVYDLYHMIVPDELVIVTGCLSCIILGFVYDWQWQPLLWGHIFSAATAFLFYAGLWFVSAGRWIGFGDAKLVLPLALLLGPLGTFSLVVFSFWIGAGISVLLLAVQSVLKRGKNRLSKYGFTITMKSEVPFAPFMIIAFLLVALLQADVLRLISLTL